MQPQGDSAGRQVVALRQGEVPSLRLPAHSRFNAYELMQHVSNHPDLAYRLEGANDFIVGGLWRHRADIGAILAARPGAAGKDLLAALLDAFQARGCPLVMVDAGEQERNLRFYLQQGFQLIETVIQLDRRGLRADEPAGEPAIRTIEARDVEAVLDVERESFPWLWWNCEAELLWYAGVSGVELYAALDAIAQERIIGYVGFSVFSDEGHLDRLAVRSDYQGRGYGSALLAFALRRMYALGARRVALTTQIDNERSQSLYARFGFRKSGWQYSLYGKWLRADLR